MRLLIVPASAAAVLVAIVVAIPTAQQQPAGAYTQRQAEAGRDRLRGQLRRLPWPRSHGIERRAGAHWPQLQRRVGRAADQRALPARHGNDAPAGAGIARRRDDAQRHRVPDPAGGRRVGIAGPHDQNGDDDECGCVEPRKRSALDGAWRRHRKRTGSRRRRCRARRHRQRRSEELRPCDAGDAEESACRATGSSSAAIITDGATARSIRSRATTSTI